MKQGEVNSKIFSPKGALSADEAEALALSAAIYNRLNLCILLWPA